MIAAQTNSLSGVIDLAKKSFAFKVPIASFKGFNSPLQRDHFNENYMQSGQYPEATFVGKIIEDIDVHTPGRYEVRAKGRFTIHGIVVERMIRGQVTVGPNNKLELKAAFTVPLADHQILIPRLVSEKLAQVIAVDMSATLLPE